MAWFGSATTPPTDPTKPKLHTLAPAPLAPVPLLPVDTTLAASTATAAAGLAAKKQKKKAIGVGDALSPAPIPGLKAPAVLAPKALLGS